MPGLAHFCEHLLFMVRFYFHASAVQENFITIAGNGEVPTGKRVLCGMYY